MNREKMLKAFKLPEERLLFAKTLDVALLCQKQHINTYTDFLDPVKTAQFLAMLKEVDIFASAFGGNDFCERKIIGFSLEKDLYKETFPIAKLEVKYNEKFSKSLTHRDFLGSILGLSIARSKVGDIIISKSSAFVYVSKDISQFICLNLLKVSKTSVTVTESNNFLEQDEQNEQEEKIKSNAITVSSLRLDAVLSVAFKISRSKSSQLVDSEKVFVNWVLVKNGTKQVAENDVITVRGIGRITINGFSGKSKKDKFIINISSTF